MKTVLKIVLVFALCALAVILYLKAPLPLPPQTFVLAPPAPADSATSTNLSPPPPDAIVFDLKYQVQTGGKDDISYYSFWGFGGSQDAARTNPFLKSVRQRAFHLTEVNNSALPGREWAAVEHQRGRALAFYFDLDANGVCSDNERILPTRLADFRGVQFITPDFLLKRTDGSELLFRVLLQVNFYDDSTPHCMWSPACLLEGAATIAGKPARLLLFGSGFQGEFTRFGASSYALRLGLETNTPPGQYVSRETLSSVIGCEGQYYRLKFEGQRPNGHVARALLVKDTTPTGTLAVKLAGTNSPLPTLNYLYLQGDDDKTVYLHLPQGNQKLPAGAYNILRGAVTYGRDWEVSFTQGPRVVIAADQPAEVVIGAPTLKVRAIDERHRYSSNQPEATVFKQGTRIYLEPAIVGVGQEVYGRFRRKTGPKAQLTDAPPQLTITGPDGKVLLTKTMEYG